MSPARIGIFGAGLIGARHVKEAADRGVLGAIADPSEAAQDLAQAHGVPWYPSPEACIAKGGIDAAVIATPNHLHADQAELCLAHGLPSLIEKPIADSLENASRIVAASARTGVPVLVGHHRRHNPLIERAKEIIEAGQLGKIIAVTGQFWLYKPDDYFDMRWRSEPGGGPMLINCIHDIDLMRHLVGEIEEVQSMISRAQRGSQVEDTAAITLRFAGGGLGSFSVSDTIAAPWSWEMTSGENPIYPHLAESCYRIGGTHGALSIPDLRLWSHPGTRSWWEPMTHETHSVATGDAFSRQFDHFLDVINGAAPRVSAQEGLKSLRATLRCAGAA